MAPHWTFFILAQTLKLSLIQYFLSTKDLFSSISVKPYSAAMPSDLEKAMESMIMVFHKYASKEGVSNTLSRKELKDLMENELAGFLKVCSLFFLSVLLFLSLTFCIQCHPIHS